MTPWYQLTRLIWWPRSRTVAVALAAVAVGGAIGGLAALGWYPARGEMRGNLVTGFVVAAVTGTIAAVGVRQFRRQWAELEALGDVDRLIAIHAVHFGDDVGSERLALATLEFAAWQRAWIASRRPWSIAGLTGLLAAQLLIASWAAFQSGIWVGGIAVGALAVGLFLALWRASQALKELPGRLWNAEWYARWRLGRLDPPPS